MAPENPRGFAALWLIDHYWSQRDFKIMGLLDSVIGSVTGQSQSGPSSPIVKALLLLLAAKAASSYMSRGSAPANPAPPSGDGTVETGILKGLPGLDGILDKFKGAGLGGKVDSWIGHGPNAPVQPADVQHALGQETIDQLAQQTGLPQDQLMAQLSTALPQVIDKLSPDGKLPAPADRGHW